MSVDRAVSLGSVLVRELPLPDVRTLAAAVLGGEPTVRGLRTQTAGVVMRGACTRVLQAGLTGGELSVLAGVLLGAADAAVHKPRVDLVWTGPDSGSSSGRLTSATVVDLIDQARTSILLIGFAVHSPPAVTAALLRAQERQVELTLLLERSADNPAYASHGDGLAAVAARRLCWPGSTRPPKAALHAKVLVVDDAAALVGSANVTGAALEKNLECGLLVRGGPTARRITQHVERLVSTGELLGVP